MALARALVTLVHQSITYHPGDTFEYAGELKDAASEGMEWVTKKTTKVFDEAKAEVLKALQQAAAEAHRLLDDLKNQLSADPSRGDLVAQVLEAETKAQDADQAVAAAAMPAETDLV
jgi:predicted Zn-dependent protease